MILEERDLNRSDLERLKVRALDEACEETNEILDSLEITDREEEEPVEKIEKSQEAPSPREKIGIPARKIYESKLRRRVFKNWLHRGISEVRRRRRRKILTI